MSKIAAMGNLDSIFGFESVGLGIFPTDGKSSEEQVMLLRKIVKGEYDIILITEDLFLSLEDEIDKYRENPLPVILPVPGASGNKGIGMKAISKSVEKAVGSDILKD